MLLCFFFKQKTAYEMRISDWSSDVCSSDLQRRGFLSNRKAERRQKDSEDGKIASGAKALDQAMAEAGADTLGQFLNGRDEKRVRLDGDSQSYDFYPQDRKSTRLNSSH